MKSRTIPAKAAKHALLVLLVLFSVFPLYWMLVSSLKDPGEIYTASVIPTRPTMENYVYAMSDIPIVRMLFNSIVVSSLQVVLQLATAVFAAYALVRWKFVGRGLVLAVFTLTWLVPFQATLIPNYIQINAWHMKGNLLAIVLPNMASAFACLSLYQAFNAFPRALLDAARMEGRSELRTLFQVVLPNMRGQLASFAILLFINAWNDYMWPMLVSGGLENSPIQIGLKSFVGQDTNMWGTLMAATTISCLPILALYLVLQKNIVESFMKWGLK